MRRALGAAAVLLALAGASVLESAGRAVAQPAADRAAPSGDVPAGPATIRGQIVHPTDPAATANVDVVLYALPPNGAPGVRRTRSDARGAFAFEGVGNDPDIAYLVGARYGDVPFPGERVAFQPGETERAIDVKIAEATADPRGVEAVEGVLTLERTASGLRVTESWRLLSPGSRVVNVPASARAGGRPAFETTLPAGATSLVHPLGMKPDGVVQRGDALLFFGPVYPGEQELTYSYDLPHAAGALVIAKTLTTGARSLRVRAPAALGPLAAPGFAAAEDATAREAGFLAIEAKALAPGRRVELSLELPPLRNDPALLVLEEVALQVGLDAQAMLFAHERWSLRVLGDAPLAGTTDAPLLRIPVPDDAEDLRFEAGAQRLGLVPDPRGGLAVTGPLPPGESTLELAYRRPIAAGPVELSLRFERPARLLSIYIEDTGLIIGSDRLHRRRPVRGENGAYLHLEAFDVEAGENVALRLTPLPPASLRARGFAIAGVLAAAGLAVAWLVAPLAGRAGSEARDEEELPLLRRERESLYAAMRDLDDDHETGKIDTLDWHTMRDDLRRRALSLLAVERAAAVAGSAGAGVPTADARPAPEGPSAARDMAPPAFCASCGAAVRAADRYCSSCGARLGPGASEPPSREAASA